MPRIRSIKPDVWQDEAFGQVSIEAQCLFIGLITQADDEGRLNGSLDRLRIQIWPYKTEVDAARVDRLLDELAARDLVGRYTVGGKPYVFLPGWKKNQRIDRPSKSDLPAPSEADPSGAQTPAFDESSRAFASPRPGREGKGEEGNSSASALAAAEVVTLPRSSKGRSFGSPGETTESGTARAESGGHSFTGGTARATDETTSRSATAAKLFEYWRDRLNKPKAKFTADRRSKVEGRLRDGYTEADIRKAIDGAARAAFVNDNGKRFDDLELICRNGSKLEDFIGRADGAQPGTTIGRNPTAPTPSSASLVDALNRSKGNAA